MYLSYNGENTYIALMKFKCLVTSLVLPMLLLSGLSSYSQRIVTLQSLLREMVDFNAVAKWPAPYYQLFQASSYDRGGGQNVG